MHHRQPVPRVSQLGGQAYGGPGGMVAQLAGEHPDRQRQVAAQAGDLAHRGIAGGQAGPGRQPGEQRRRLSRGEDIEADHRGVFQRGQPAAAGDQHQAARGAGQQRPDLFMAGRVIEQQQDLLARHLVTPAPGPGLQPRRDLRRGHPRGQQQARQRIGRVDRPLAHRVGVQRQEKLPIGEARRQPVRCVHREGGLADPGHPVDGVDLHHAAVVRRGGQCPHQLCELGLAAGEGGDVTRQGPGRRRRERLRRHSLPGRQHIGGRGLAAGRGDEEGAHLLRQAQRIG